MAISIQTQFLAAARAHGVTPDAALLEAKRMYAASAPRPMNRVRAVPIRPNGWVPSVGDSVLVVRPAEAPYPASLHGVTMRVSSLTGGEFAVCTTKRGNNWSRLTAIPLADLYPSDKPPIDPRPVQSREDAWAGKRVAVSGCDSRHYGRRGVVVRGSRGKCVVRLNRGGEYEIAKADLKIVG